MKEKFYKIQIDEENNVVEWWDAARESESAPTELRPLLNGETDSIVVDQIDLDTIFDWAEDLPGWNDGAVFAPHPLLITEHDI